MTGSNFVFRHHEFVGSLSFNPQRLSSDCFFSVIVPTRTLDDRLFRSLYALEIAQSELNTMELILVLDLGSEYNLKLAEYQARLIEKNFPLLSGQILLLTRKPEFESSFLAASARNAGASFARGQCLLFLDHDVRINRDLLDEFRMKSAPKRVLNSSRLEKKWSSKREARYWLSAYESHGNIFEQPQGWKYFCSHSLCIQHEDWRTSGGFQSDFLNYGHEDTELGYRLAKSGFHFSFTKSKTYHDSPPHNPKLRRNEMLKSASVFRRLHPEQDVVEFLSYLEVDSIWKLVRRQWTKRSVYFYYFFYRPLWESWAFFTRKCIGRTPRFGLLKNSDYWSRGPRT